MKVKSLRFWLICISVFLAGCAGMTGLSPDRYLSNKYSYMVTQGNPPSYVAGYVDGCATGRGIAGDKRFKYRKNNTRAERDALYARGWQDGQINCRNEVLQETCDPLKPERIRPGNAPLGLSLDEARRQRVEAESRAADSEINEIWEELKK